MQFKPFMLVEGLGEQEMEKLCPAFVRARQPGYRVKLGHPVIGNPAGDSPWRAVPYLGN